jgi:hypothetical protein
MTSENLPDDDQTVDESEDAEVLADGFIHYETAEVQNRLWIKAIVPILQLRSRDAHVNVRVQYALDRLHIAACERLTRILASDLPPVEG